MFYVKINCVWNNSVWAPKKDGAGVQFHVRATAVEIEKKHRIKILFHWTDVSKEEEIAQKKLEIEEIVKRVEGLQHVTEQQNALKVIKVSSHYEL